MRLIFWKRLMQSRSGHPWYFNIKTQLNTARVSRLSFHFLWLWWFIITGYDRKANAFSSWNSCLLLFKLWRYLIILFIQSLFKEYSEHLHDVLLLNCFLLWIRFFLHENVHRVRNKYLKVLTNWWIDYVRILQKEK